MNTNQTTGILAGFAEEDFTPAPGLQLAGQHYVRVAERTRDPLLANAVALREGDETIVIVSVDLCLLEPSFTKDAQRLFAERTGLQADRLLVHTTHSHVAPVAIPRFWGDPDPAFMQSLREHIIRAAQSAISKLEPVTVYAGLGRMDHLNWNRRSMFANGTSVMHGSADAEGFIGTEEARDPNLGVIYFRNAESKITGIIANFGTHPNCVESGLYYSADLPGELRRLLKSVHGSKTGVVYLTGSAGNTTPVMHEPGSTEQPWMGEAGLERSGLLLFGEICKVMGQAIHPIDRPQLAVGHTNLMIPLRPYPSPNANDYPNSWGGESEVFYRTAEADWPRKMREESPADVRLNVIRIGDTVICTNPAEIFSEFALLIRAASPARVTLISQLTDGYCGYIPTRAAFTRGGYETWPCPTSKLSTDAGVAIVEGTTKLLAEVF